VRTNPENPTPLQDRYFQTTSTSGSKDSSAEFIKELMDPEKGNPAVDPSLVRKRRRKRRRRSL
jgi:hypothetical protein